MEKFRERLGGMGRNERSTEEMMEQDIGKIRKALEEEEQEGGRKRTGWWNEECREKTQVRRKWRRGKGSRKEYTITRKEYKELCEE